MNRKVVFVSDSVYPFQIGGKERRLYDISRCLQQAGYEVHIYTMKWWSGPKKIIKRDHIYFHAICRRLSLYSGNRRSLLQSFIFGISCIKLLNVKADIIDVDQIPFTPILAVWLVCKMTRTKLIVTWHEVWTLPMWQSYVGIAGIVAWHMQKLLVHLPAKIFAVSQGTADQIRSELLRKNDVLTLPNTVDVNYLRSIVPASINNDVIFAGRLLSHKRVDLLIGAIKVITTNKSDINCIIVGEGPELKNLQTMTRNLKLDSNITFHKFFNNSDDLYALIKASRVYVSPSEREGFGIGVLESIVCQTPAITSDTPANASKHLIKENINGSVVSPTVEAIAESINEWLSRRIIDEPEFRYLYDTKKNKTKILEAYSQ